MVLERLGVVPVAEGSWTAARLAQGEVLATWSLVVALAVRFGCNRPIPPSVPLTVQELTVQDGDVDNPVKVGGAPPRSLPALGVSCWCRRPRNGHGGVHLVVVFV